MKIEDFDRRSSGTIFSDPVRSMMTGWSASVWWPATTLHITERVEALSGLRLEANSVVEDLDSGRPLVIGRGQAAWDQWRREKIPCEAPIVKIECMYIKED